MCRRPSHSLSILGPGVRAGSSLEQRPPQRPRQAPAFRDARSVFQTNRRVCFSQRDLEEKMVHKVTMDTVKIITSSVSGMTNVSSLPISGLAQQNQWLLAAP